MSKMKNSTFDMQLINGKAKIVRKIDFEGGDSISFDVSLRDFHDLTVAEIHKKSARKAIELLEEWLKPPAPSA